MSTPGLQVSTIPYSTSSSVPGLTRLGPTRWPVRNKVSDRRYGRSP